MPETVNTAVTARARFTQAGVPYTPSPAPTCTVYRYVGSPTTRTTLVTAQATFAEGGDAFSYTLSSGNNDTVGVLEFAFTTSDTAVDDADLSAWVDVEAAASDTPTAAENAAAVWDRLTSALTTPGSIGAALVALLNAASSIIHVNSNPTPSGRLTIYAGADYYSADQTSPIFTSTSTLALDTATLTLNVQALAFAIVVTGSSGAYTMTVTPMARTDTATLTVDQPTYQLRFTLANGHKGVLAEGTAVIKPLVGS